MNLPLSPHGRHVFPKASPMFSIKEASLSGMWTTFLREAQKPVLKVLADNKTKLKSSHFEFTGNLKFL